MSWTHHLGTVVEATSILATNSHQEIILEGRLNDQIDLAQLLLEAKRVLKLGGKISLHGLAADRDLQDAAPALAAYCFFIQSMSQAIQTSASIKVPGRNTSDSMANPFPRKPTASPQAANNSWIRLLLIA